MSSLQSLIASMIKDSPPGNNIRVINDLQTILDNNNSSKIISQNLSEYHLNSDFKLVKLTDDGDFGIISKYNKSGLKFYDPSLKVKFDYDFKTLKVVDVEDDASVEIHDPKVNKLNKDLAQYSALHYPTFYKSIVVPDQENSDIIYLVIVDENLNDANFYNGKWQSFYKYDQSTNQLDGEILIKIHYYEDGNVILKTSKKINLEVSSIDKLIDSIEKFENEFELTVLKKFSNLNESQFKGLRRQLPINGSKVQWGKAIGNYKLGQDVAGGRH